MEHLDLALPANIRQDRKSLSGSNTPAYFGPLISYGEKKFYNIGPWSLKSDAQWLNGLGRRHPSLIFASKAGAYPCGVYFGTPL